MSSVAPARQQHHSIGEGRIALLAVLMVQVVVGYEWLMSGLAKVARSGFVSGLASDLRAQSPSAHWYRSFLNDTVIPNSHFFAYLIIVGELAVGATFIIAAGLWLWRWEHLPVMGRMGVLAATALAALAAILMNIAFHLAGGASHPWILPKGGYGGGVDLNSLMPLLQFVLLVVSVDLLVRLRRTTREA